MVRFGFHELGVPRRAREVRNSLIHVLRARPKNFDGCPSELAVHAWFRLSAPRGAVSQAVRKTESFPTAPGDSVQADPSWLPFIPDNGSPDDLADGEIEGRRRA